jgi:RHS repeat-associated protein
MNTRLGKYIHGELRWHNSISLCAADGSIGITAYTYDANGNRLSKPNETLTPIGSGAPSVGLDLNSGFELYEYDVFNRQRRANIGGIVTTYIYAASNLRHSKTTGGVTTTHIWDGSNISLDIVDGTATKYIRGIGLISSGDTFYLYNAHGDVVQLTDTAGSVVREYDYDAFGNERGEERPNYGDVDGDGVIDSADITLLRRYISAENKSQFQDENPRFNLDNARVTGHSGNPNANDVATLRQYVAGFGVTLGADVGLDEDTNPFRHAGEYLDFETGTYYLRARYYNPVIGRFTQADPHWHVGNMVYGNEPVRWNERPIDPDDPLGLTIYTFKPNLAAIMQSGNLYVYCGNDPINRLDPSGEAWFAIPVVIKAVKVAVVAVKVKVATSAATIVFSAHQISSMISNVGANKMTHIMQSKHAWHLLGNSNWTSISNAINHTLAKGTQAAYKAGNIIHTATYNGQTVQVVTRMENGTRIIVDAWVKTK